MKKPPPPKFDLSKSVVASASLQPAIDIALPQDDAPPPRRIRLWECRDNIHCSVIGTCASVQDIRDLASRVKAPVDLSKADYTIHGVLVRECTKDTPFARAFQKLMDKRYAGALRRVSRAKTQLEQCRLWEDMRDRGMITGAYWAFMTSGHIDRDLRHAIFGEVHMLSHLAGSGYRRRTIQAVALQDQLQEASERAQRVEAGLRTALGERDEEVASLRDALAKARAAQATAGVEEIDTKKLKKKLGRLERALMATRVRARQAEAALSSAQNTRNRKISRRKDQIEILPDATRDGVEQQSIAGRTILYIGGLSGQVDRLKAVAAEFEAELVHHDGGMEDAVRRIDHLLPSVDCVLCPIDCVSHDACLRAKRKCRLHGKPFLPLRTSSQSALRAALADLSPTEGRS